MSTSREVVLLLADLSGYTAYLAASEPERAPALAADLVETVVRQLRPTFRLEKLEGDAAFMVAPTDRLTGIALLDAIDATTAAFRTRLRSLSQSTTCDCEACRRIPELGLKFVVHAGDVVTQRVAGRTDAGGGQRGRDQSPRAERRGARAWLSTNHHAPPKLSEKVPKMPRGAPAVNVRSGTNVGCDVG